MDFKTFIKIVSIIFDVIKVALKAHKHFKDWRNKKTLKPPSSEPECEKKIPSNQDPTVG